MTSTLTRTSQAVAEWSKVFPRQATETYTSSVTFIKQLTVVAVSTITYLKNAFPEDNYTVDQFGGLKIRVLKNKCEDELAQFLISALTQAFEAFEKKYLHQIALCFYAECCRPDNLVEYHVFEYGYGPAGATVSVRSGGAGGAAAGAGGGAAVSLDAVRDRTVQLLRACMVMLSHTQLPETYDVSLRLYYNDDAPEGYQAPGFSEVRGAEPDEVLGAEGRVKLGSVATPFHRLQLHTYHRDLRAHTPDASETTPAASQQDEFTDSDRANVGTPMAGVVVYGAGGAAGAAGGAVRCECGRAEPDPHMLTCSHCGSRQHATCYGVRADGAAGAGAAGGDAGDVGAGAAAGGGGAHCCVPCCERAPAARRADAGLMRAANRTCYAIFRRALWWLRGGAGAGGAGGAGVAGGAVCCGALGAALGLGAGSARKLMRVLHAHHLVSADPPADPDEPVEIVPSQLEAALARYFAPPAADDLGSRLARQARRPHADPLAEVLSPLERVSLQAAPAAPTAPTAAPPPPPADGTLAQYRSALPPAEAEAPPRAPAAPARKRRQAGGRSPAPGVRTKRVRKASRE